MESFCRQKFFPDLTRTKFFFKFELVCTKTSNPSLRKFRIRLIIPASGSIIFPALFPPSKNPKCVKKVPIICLRVPSLMPRLPIIIDIIILISNISKKS